jgi:hypothetical protein
MGENTLGDEAVAELAKTVREVSRRMMNEQPHRGRWQFHGGGSGKSCNTVRFQVLVADPLTRTALCVITARPYGCGVNDIPGTLVSGQAIEVCDPGGCFFNETNPPLVGREGWASYMMPVQGSTWCQQNPYYGMLPEWEVFSLCCATDACLL